MTSLKSYRDLVVWQRSMLLVTNVYELTRSFSADEKFGLTSQMRRAAVSIPSNIAEGQARRTKGEFLQFLGVARGSLAELETLILVSDNLKLFTNIDSQTLLHKCEEIGKLLNGLTRSLNSKP